MWANAINDERILDILSNSAKFSAGQSLITAYNFSGTVASIFSTYRLGPVASLKFMAIENMPRITVTIFVDCCQLEAHSFETAQHIDKPLSYRSSRINDKCAIKPAAKWGPSLQRDFSATQGERC